MVFPLTAKQDGIKAIIIEQTDLVRYDKEKSRWAITIALLSVHFGGRHSRFELQFRGKLYKSCHILERTKNT